MGSFKQLHDKSWYHSNGFEAGEIQTAFNVRGLLHTNKPQKSIYLYIYRYIKERLIKHLKVLQNATAIPAGKLHECIYSVVTGDY